jgi:spore maturation protein CgeB
MHAMSQSSAYSAEPVTDGPRVTDIRLHVGGKTWHLWGRKADERETGLANGVGVGTLPVLIGAGLGICLEHLLAREFPVAVIDREQPIDEITRLKAKHADSPGVLWLDQDDPRQIMDRLTRWQREHGGLPFDPVVLPLYLRLDRDHYVPLAETLKANRQTDFWSQARYPKFRSASPRVLFIDSGYFLCGEILSAMESEEIEYRVLPFDRNQVTGSQPFVETLLSGMIDFKPDFLLTVNHFGLDREGKLAGLLAELGLPLVSWFVDNPCLILHEYDHPGADNTLLFTFDAGNLDQLRAMGFGHVHYLPLATDPDRFAPSTRPTGCGEWASPVSFVGNSMVGPVSESLAAAMLPAELSAQYPAVAAAFGATGMTSVTEYLQANHPDWHAALKGLPTPENRLALESLLTWEATRQYRLSCVRGTLPFRPLIVGDAGWKQLLPHDPPWRYMDRLDYYGDLPRFYPCSAINFNCTSRQMIGAVNQRVFDVPACGGFLITDHREQMEDLFDLDLEAVVYRSPAEVPDLVQKLLDDEPTRLAITAAARRRILAEHTYRHRLDRLLSVTRDTFSS